MAHEVFPPSPDRIAFYPAESRQSVLAALRDDVEAGRHLLCVTGDAGSGKTALLRELRRRLQGSIGLIEQPVPNQLLRDVARSLGLDTSDQESEPILRRRMVMQLALAEQRRQPIVLIVDDADRLPKQDIELLLHFFPPGHATLVLAGEAPPQDWLDLCVMAAGPVRADAAYRLEPLTAEETAGYLRHRLRAAGLPEDLFRADAAEAIHRQGGGVPGRIHRLSADVLVSAALQGDDSVTGHAVAQTLVPVAADSERASADASAEAPLLARRRRSAHSLRPLVVPSEVRLAGEPRRSPVRRLQRSVWRWRAAAILAGIALVAVLVRDLPTGAALSARLADLLAVREAPERTADGPVRPRGTEHADAPAQASADTEAWENDAAEFAALSAP
ncbi:MAG: ExeA family protein, partial [Gammaproteobacteria bacterium]